MYLANAIPEPFDRGYINENSEATYSAGEAFLYYLDGEVTIEIEEMEPIVGLPGNVGHVPYRKLHRAVAGEKGAKVLIFRVHVEDEPESYTDPVWTTE